MTEINIKNFAESLYRFNDLYKDIQRQIEYKTNQINSAKENLEKIKKESVEFNIIINNIEKLKQIKKELENSISKSINTTDKGEMEKNTEEEKKNLSDLTQQYSYTQQILEGLYAQNNIRESDDLENIKINFSRRIEYFNNILRVLEREKNELDGKSKNEIIVKANKINNYIDNFDTVRGMEENLNNIMRNINSKQIDLVGDLGNILTYFYVNSANNKNNKTIIRKFLEIADRLSNDKSKDELVKECVIYSILVYNQSVEKEEQNMNKLKEFFKNRFDIDKYKNENKDLNVDLQIELDKLKEICNNLNNGLGKKAYNPKELNYFN